MKRIESLKQIIENFESKILVRYRFDKGAYKDKTNCSHCAHFKDGYCDFFKDNVNPKYTCDKFKKRDE